MPWVVTVDGQKVNLIDLPIRAFVELEKSTGRTYLELQDSPAKTASSALGVYEMACKHLGLADAAERVERLTFRQVAESFELVPDDLPTEYEGDGAVLLPKAEAVPSMSG